MEIRLKKLSPDAKIPTQAKADDAGYDLYATEDYELKPLERKLFKTGIAIAIPKGYYGRIAPRSGLAYKNGIEILGGVIDSSYRDDVGVILMNLNAHPDYGVKDLNVAALMIFIPPNDKRTLQDKNTLVVKKGDRIAQIIIEKRHDAEWNEVDELDVTDRGQNGFGSTGN